MKIVTVINNLYHIGFNLLRLSCAMNNLELVTLVAKGKDFESFRIKDQLLKQYLHKQKGHEIIFFSDGYDAFLLAGEEEILDKYCKHNRDIVFSCETSCWPDPSLASNYPSIGSNSNYRFLNSGGFIGRADAIMYLLEDETVVENNFKKSNQYVWTKKYFSNTDKITLDTECDIFQTFSPEIGESYMPKDDNTNYQAYYKFMKQWFKSNFKLDKNRILNCFTHTWPCHAHFNGAAKLLIDNDIIDLIYSKTSQKHTIQFIHDYS